MSETSSKKTINSLFWKTLERLGFHGIKLFVSVLLARLLCPDDFGVLGIVTVFVDFATIFVQSGLNTSLIQAKEVSDTEFSSVFWLSLGIAGVLYLLIFFCSPIIAHFYENQALVGYLRFFSLVLFGGALNSIQIAYASRTFDFKSQFFANICAVVVSGTVSIVMAFRGFGIWALVVQQLLWQYVSCIVMFFFVRWVPKFSFDVHCVIPLFQFGWKMFLSSLLIKINSMISGLLVGKRFSTETLGYYSKAANFPTAFSDVAVNSISSVSLVSFSKQQNDVSAGREDLIKYVQYSTFFIAPMLLGLAAVSDSFIDVLLTAKWAPAATYLRIFCILYLFQPLCAIFGQATSGMGRSDLYLRVYMIVKPIGLGLVFAISFVTKSAIYVAAATVMTAVIETAVQSINVKKVLNISMMRLFKAWYPAIISSVLMFIVTYFIGRIVPFYSLVKLCIQIVIGTILYVFFSFIINRRNSKELIKVFRSKIQGGRK